MGSNEWLVLEIAEKKALRELFYRLHPDISAKDRTEIAHLARIGDFDTIHSKYHVFVASEFAYEVRDLVGEGNDLFRLSQTLCEAVGAWEAWYPGNAKAFGSILSFIQKGKTWKTANQSHCSSHGLPASTTTTGPAATE
jgi:hypothetical protein